MRFTTAADTWADAQRRDKDISEAFNEFTVKIRDQRRADARTALQSDVLPRLRADLRKVEAEAQRLETEAQRLKYPTMTPSERETAQDRRERELYGLAVLQAVRALPRWDVEALRQLARTGSIDAMSFYVDLLTRSEPKTDAETVQADQWPAKSAAVFRETVPNLAAVETQLREVRKERKAVEHWLRLTEAGNFNVIPGDYSSLAKFYAD